MTVAFYILSAVAIVGGILAIRLRNLIHAVFSLLLLFTALAGLFLLLLAEFIAAVQVLVYVGAVGILMLFAIMLTQKVTGDSERKLGSTGWLGGIIVTVSTFFGVLYPAITKSNLVESPVVAEIIPSVKTLGKRLMDPYVITLEVTALLLTAALIGAVVVALGGEGEKGEEELAATDEA